MVGFSTTWLALLGLLAFLMVSTWRYPASRSLSLLRPRSPLTFVVVSGAHRLSAASPQPILLGLSAAYVGAESCFAQAVLCVDICAPLEPTKS